jgi:hypothetical protein
LPTGLSAGEIRGVVERRSAAVIAHPVSPSAALAAVSAVAIRVRLPDVLGRSNAGAAHDTDLVRRRKRSTGDA